MIRFASHVALTLLLTAFLPGPGWLRLAAGFALGFAALWVVAHISRHPPLERYVRILPQAILLAVYFIKELTLSCLRVARDCVAPRPAIHASIVRMPLDVESDLGIFFVANLISLTPGTLTLDVAPDRSFLVIHSIYAHDADVLVAELKSGMEHRVRKVFR